MQGHQAPLSTLALTMTRSLYRTGDVPEPQPVVPVPTLVDQICLPLRSKQRTPVLPKNTYTCLPSLAGVLEA